MIYNKKHTRHEFEDEILYDYQTYSFRTDDIKKKYKISFETLMKIVRRNGIKQRQKGSATRLQWFDGVRKSPGTNKNGTKDIYGGFILRWKANAKTRGLEFNLSNPFLQRLLERQNYKCAITGIDLVCPNRYYKFKETRGDWRLISLDRINSDLGYTEDNVQFLCAWLNIAKNRMKNDDMIHIISEIRNVA